MFEACHILPSLQRNAIRAASVDARHELRRLQLRPSHRNCRGCCHAVVGIDLGTTHSAVSVLEGGTAKVIPADGEHMLLASLVCFQPMADPVVGSRADECSGGILVDNIKRLMGKTFAESASLQQQASYPVREAADGTIEVVCLADGHSVSPEQVSAEILKALKLRAEAYLESLVDSVVITVPSHFSPQQRLATMNAATASGLERVSLLQEPIAAAIAHGLGNAQDEEPAILVVDVGGGTCDVTLLQSFEGILEVTAYDGDDSLGGIDIDFAIIRWWIEHGMLPAGAVGSMPVNCTRLRSMRKLAEHCKIELSSQATCSINLLIDDANSSAVTMSQTDLEVAAAPFLKRLWAPLQRLGQEHHIEYAHYPFDCQRPAQASSEDCFAPPPRLITKLLLVGGATKAPLVREFLERITGCKRHALAVDPDHCVAIGAGVHAGIMVGEVTAGVEMADSIYVQNLQSRTSGFQM